MATEISILKNKGKILSVLAAAKKFPNIRKLFSITIRLYSIGRIKKLSSITKVPETKIILSKLNRQESNFYNKTLVPLGFPKNVVVPLTGREIRATGIRVAADADSLKSSLERFDIEERIIEVLQEHIDYLHEESFFQKAHKAAKTLNIIDRSEEARMFYHNYAINYGTGFTYTNMLREGGKRKSIPLRGKMMFFRYRPDEVTSTYDLYPLIFVLDRKKDYFTGINFHYIIPKMRAVLLGDMFSYLSDLNFDISTQLNFRQFLNVVDTNKKFKFAKQAIRRYNYKNILSKIINVHPLDWELAIMVETEKFFTERNTKITSRKIWKDTRVKALSN